MPGLISTPVARGSTTPKGLLSCQTRLCRVHRATLCWGCGLERGTTRCWFLTPIIRERVAPSRPHWTRTKGAATSFSSKDLRSTRNGRVHQWWHGGGEGRALQWARGVPKVENHCFRGASRRIEPSGLWPTWRLWCAPQSHHEQVEALYQGFRWPVALQCSTSIG
jgi:hypothetical protein